MRLLWGSTAILSVFLLLGCEDNTSAIVDKESVLLNVEHGTSPTFEGQRVIYRSGNNEYICVTTNTAFINGACEDMYPGLKIRFTSSEYTTMICQLGFRYYVHFADSITIIEPATTDEISLDPHIQ